MKTETAIRKILDADISKALKVSKLQTLALKTFGSSPAQAMVLQVAKHLLDSAHSHSGILPVGMLDMENYYGTKSNPTKRNPADPLKLILAEDSKGLVHYYAGDTARGILLTQKQDEARQLSKAAALAVLASLRASRRGVGYSFGIVPVKPVKANGDIITNAQALRAISGVSPAEKKRIKAARLKAVKDMTLAAKIIALRAFDSAEWVDSKRR